MTVRELAKMANVSIATISMVLNDKPGVGEETRERVLALVRETGYVIKPPRASSSRSKGTIRFLRVRAASGMIIDRNEEFMTRMLDGMLEAAEQAGKELVVSNVDMVSLEASLPSLNSAGDDGIILLATEMHDHMLQVVRRIQRPLIILDNEMHQQNVDAVTMNSEQGAYLVARHLRELGHRRIGFITSRIPIASFVARERGLGQAAAELDFVYDKKYRLELTPDLGHTYQNDAMDPDLLAQPDFPTAFFAADDILALIALRLFRHIGKRVPEDYSLVGMDNLQISASATPRLTTVKLPNETMGRMAVKRLLDKLENPSESPMKTLVGCDLVVRKSTAPPRAEWMETEKHG